MAGLCAPLPTLRRRPYGLRRTARGRYGSLLLHRIGLAPTARCRSPGALRKILDTTHAGSVQNLSHFRLAERHPALAHAVMSPLICWSFSNSMFRYLFVDHAVLAVSRERAEQQRRGPRGHL